MMLLILRMMVGRLEGDIIMKKSDLKKILIRMEIPPSLYILDGDGRTDERFCLEFLNGEWIVYFSERGVRTTNEKFLSEEEACQFIYEQFC